MISIFILLYDNFYIQISYNIRLNSKQNIQIYQNCINIIIYFQQIMGCAAQKKQLTQNKMQEGQQAIKDHQFDNLINKIQTYKSLQVSRNHSPALKSSNSDIGPQISGKDHNEDKLDYIKLSPNDQDHQEGNQVCFDITPMFEQISRLHDIQPVSSRISFQIDQYGLEEITVISLKKQGDQENIEKMIVLVFMLFLLFMLQY
ncbi:hypothetical protein pb186bvf_002864 [Paramecium bursaria]